MATPFDVAAYILAHTGTIDTFKLQKLVYYSQAWNLVWTDRSLFEDEIQAWPNGPVVPPLWNQSRGMRKISACSVGAVGNLTVTQRAAIDAVLARYGSWDSQRLVDQTHAEQPWRDARKGLGALDRSTNTISLETMKDFYSAAAPAQRPMKPVALRDPRIAALPEWAAMDDFLDGAFDASGTDDSPEMLALAAKLVAQ